MGKIKDQEGQQNKNGNGPGQQRPQKKNKASTETGLFDGATPGSWRFLWWLTDRLGRLFCNFCGNPTTLAKESTGQESEGYGGKLEYRIPGVIPFIAYARMSAACAGGLVKSSIFFAVARDVLVRDL